ncbi:unnamed protein product [Callosobruchus maculatus]|uniref:Uncharacterized protein n=1 Tax=Callosobruchus maculatus TaxID=64391 RepID=A0A653D9M1_CALMS|nr:unnamed protein product [Callosobruchus maculatus]
MLQSTDPIFLQFTHVQSNPFSPLKSRSSPAVTLTHKCLKSLVHTEHFSIRLDL